MFLPVSALVRYELLQSWVSSCNIVFLSKERNIVDLNILLQTNYWGGYQRFPVFAVTFEEVTPKAYGFLFVFSVVSDPIDLIIIGSYVVLITVIFDSSLHPTRQNCHFIKCFVLYCVMQQVWRSNFCVKVHYVGQPKLHTSGEVNQYLLRTEFIWLVFSAFVLFIDVLLKVLQ